MLINTTVSILAGVILDFIFGDPYNFPHPIRWIGELIRYLEKRLRNEKKDDLWNFRNGIILNIIVLTVSTLTPLIILVFCYKIHVFLGVAAESVMCYQIMATKCLKVESMKVYVALKEENVEKARKAVAMIVGRDTEKLKCTEIIKATVETVAENTSDGSIAPLFYMAIGGPVLGFFYKAVNTMDSMIGYKNEKYLYFGRSAAKLDDFLNYMPSRISAVTMIFVSFLLGYDAKNACRIYKRDRKKHASPNSAQTESVCAGALGVLLAGDAFYFGKNVKKETIGDAVRPIDTEDIRRANRLLYGTVSVVWLCLLLIRIGGIILYGTV